MRVLTLTWEFPPVITGGLGMACYGIVKALLNRGIEVDVVMPAKESICFQLRRPEDADNLPTVLVDISKKKTLKKPVTIEQLTALIGSPASVYHLTTKSILTKHGFEELKHSAPFTSLFDVLSEECYFFGRVGRYSHTSVGIGLQSEFDIIHAHDWLCYPAGMMLKKLTGRPLVVHVHATEFDRAGGIGNDRIHHIEYLGMEAADKVIAVSAYTARIIAERYHIRADKIAIVHNAYTMPNSGNHYRRIFREPTVLFMGRITLQKGPDYFLEVARRIIEQEKKVRFIMAGSGDMERQILHRAASLGLGTKFLVAGFLDRREVENILASTDIFLLPSVSEPFGIAPLEAMSHGAVAIISKNSGVAEVIDNAYKIDFWDIDQMVSTILELLRNPDKYKEMSERGKAEVVNLQWEEAGGKIAQIYKAVEVTEPCLI